MKKPKFPEKLYVTLHEGGVVSYETPYEAADVDGEWTEVGVYVLEGTRTERRVVETKEHGK